MPEDYKKSKLFSLWLLFASLVGLYAASTLTLEKIKFWQQKAEGTTPLLGCDLNPIVGCGSVINTDQASIFGNIPNPVLGIIAWSVMLTIAILLLSKVSLKKWQYLGMQIGATLGLIMVSYLQYQSIYNLHALCPYCMLTWAVMIPTFWIVSRKTIDIFEVRKLNFISDYMPIFLVLHFTVLLLAIWIKFGSSIFA